jgi:glycerol-3-phosphate dehydrogenase
MAADSKEATYDVAVVGAGVVGCAVFRALVLAGARVVLIERAADILAGASKGNSAILHTAFDAPPGSVEHRCMRDGQRIYREIQARLGLPLRVSGAYLVAWSEAEAAELPAIQAKAHANGCHAVKPIAVDALRRAEPEIGPQPLAALDVPGEDLIDPWAAPLAYALQGIANGGVVLRRTEVSGGARDGDRWRLHTSRGAIRAGVVVNCAGLRGDLVEAIARPSPFAIRPRKGQFLVYDKPAARLVERILLPVPTKRTKGVVILRTVFGNLLVGPTAEDQADREDAAVSEAELAKLREFGTRILPKLAAIEVTATYAGLRPASQHSDYVIEALAPERWITVGGIRSTGLTASLGIAAHVVALYRATFASPRELPDPVWPRVPNISECGPRDWQLPGGGGEIVCHCELVTRREIEAALDGPLPAGDLGGLRRRTRAMMGRCQGFYCAARIAEIAGSRIGIAPGAAP